MKNQEIKKLLQEEHIYMWEVAKKLSIHEATFSKWFREELTDNKQQQILSAVKAIQLEKLDRKKK